MQQPHEQHRHLQNVSKPSFVAYMQSHSSTGVQYKQTQIFLINSTQLN